MIKFKSGCAFTLAEVLITLGIIGVVAAMTLPFVINKYKKTAAETRLKKVYTTLSQACLRTLGEDGDLSAISVVDYNNSSLMNWYKHYLKQYLLIEKDCLNQPGCFPPGVKKMSGSAYGDQNGIGLNIVTFRMYDGSMVNLDVYSGGGSIASMGVDSDSDAVVLFVDINGKKAPNVLGKDVFVFVFTNKGFVPAGNDRSDEVIDNNCKTTGIMCAAKIMRNGWQLSDENL